METTLLTKKIKQKALELGFESCGISKAEKLTEEEAFLKNWLDNGLHATMHYMENHFEKRLDPTKLVTNAKSVVSVIINYLPAKTQKDPNAPIVSKYAFGNDYHIVVKDRLKILFEYINTSLTPCSGRFFTDSAPVLDRAWAAKSGLGWIGKNTNLIVPNKGSFFFIGELIIDLELEYDSPIKERCGSCTKCIQACPTNALVAPYLLDSKKCISFQTIENKNEIPESLIGKFNNRVFGCDICQDVCPWNSKAKPTTIVEFTPDVEILELSKNNWVELTKEDFNKTFKYSPLKRTSFRGIQRNLKFLYNKNAPPD